MAKDTREAMNKIAEAGAGTEAARRLLREELAPQLLRYSKCRDFVEDRGHYFGGDLEDVDKYALIEFLKTF